MPLLSRASAEGDLHYHNLKKVLVDLRIAPLQEPSAEVLEYTLTYTPTVDDGVPPREAATTGASAMVTISGRARVEFTDDWAAVPPPAGKTLGYNSVSAPQAMPTIDDLKLIFPSSATLLPLCFFSIFLPLARHPGTTPQSASISIWHLVLSQRVSLSPWASKLPRTMTRQSRPSSRQGGRWRPWKRSSMPLPPLRPCFHRTQVGRLR